MNLLATVLAVAAAAAPSASPSDAVAYRVELARAGDTSVAVSLTLPASAEGPVTLVIPRAVPMGYSQQLYDRYVTDVTGRGGDDAAVPVAREDGPRWRIGATAKPPPRGVPRRPRAWSARSWVSRIPRARVPVT
jgi:hypothetical protein